MIKAVLEHVFEVYEPLIKAADSLHLTSVAKAIEHQRPCQIFMEPFGEDSRVGECKDFTGTVEPFLAFVPKEGEQKELLFLQHFIFYRGDKDPEIERFRVARQLGHCALHWPLGDRRTRRLFGVLPEIGRFYMIAFTKKEESEADAFACLLRAHRPKPERPSTVEINDEVYRAIDTCAQKGMLESVKSGT